MFLTNRAIIVIRPKQPFLDWLLATPDPPNTDLDELRSDETSIYLVPDAEDPSDVEAFLHGAYEEIFEVELSGWYDDPDYWPTDITFSDFKEWFDWEVHTMVFDLSDEEIEREPYFEEE